MAGRQLELYTIIYALEGCILPIEIENGKMVGILKRRIWKDNPRTFKGVNVCDLKLYRVDIYLHEKDINQVIRGRLEELNEEEDLSNLLEMSQVYPSTPATNTIHIIVRIPVQPFPGRYLANVAMLWRAK